MNPPAVRRYDLLSRCFHWVTAIVVTLAFVLGPDGFGRLMRQGVDPATRSGIVWHESLGMLVLALTLLRLLWVAMRPAAPRLALAGRWELAAKLMHGALWFLLLALPVTALLTLGSESHPLTLWGGVRVERLPFAGVGAVKWIDWGEVHEFLAVAMMWFAGLHAVAALFHHLVLKDGLLASMWPRARSG